jgi:Bromodomain/HMG (high mobility group) box
VSTKVRSRSAPPQTLYFVVIAHGLPTIFVFCVFLISTTAAPSKSEDVDDWSGLDEIDYTKLSVDRLRAIANREPYYPAFEGSDNPYRDGFIKEPPKKPRASYLFFQSCMRSFYGKRNPGSTQAEIMTLMGDVWRNLTDQDKEPFQQLAKEESERFDKERVMMEKAQRPNEVWQPLRRCRMVLDRLVSDSFSEIFLEPVDPEDFPDYEELIDSPMDLGTIREKLATKKYIVPEQFARDMRKVRYPTKEHWRKTDTLLTLRSFE